MGFAWHKLIPSPIEGDYDCPPPCVATGDWNTEICFCPGEGGGPIATSCDTPTCFDFVIEGENCPVFDAVFTPLPEGYVNTNMPMELRLNVDISKCSRTNDLFDNLNWNRCEMGNIPFWQPYYYRTPRTPNSTPGMLKENAICLKYRSYSESDRLMVISGRNRYKYGGIGIDPGCTYSDAYVPSIWDPIASGLTGIKQAELSLGREWPLPNSVLNLPLFGANTSGNPFFKPTEEPCSPYGAIASPCNAGNCFSVRDNRGIGHFDDENTSENQKGYYSFQCFNPTAFYNHISPDNKHVPIPTCSVWGLMQAIKQQLINYASGWDVVESNYPNTYNAWNDLLNSDPAVTNTNSKASNVRHYLDNLAYNILIDIGHEFTIPNVFLWDPDGYDAATTNQDKWKHIYIIGNANVIFDTHCMSTGNPKNGYGYVFYLDEVTHDSEIGSTGNARVILFHGCSQNTDFNTNQSSTMSFSLEKQACGYLNETRCQRCTNEGNISHTLMGCYYLGHSEGFYADYYCDYEAPP